jgi:hypothetical protein
MMFLAKLVKKRPSDRLHVKRFVNGRLRREPPRITMRIVVPGASPEKSSYVTSRHRVLDLNGFMPNVREMDQPHRS